MGPFQLIEERINLQTRHDRYPISIRRPRVAQTAATTSSPIVLASIVPIPIVPSVPNAVVLRFIVV